MMVSASRGAIVARILAAIFGCYAFVWGAVALGVAALNGRQTLYLGQALPLLEAAPARDMLYLPEDPTTTMGLDTFIASIIRSVPHQPGSESASALDPTIRPYFEQMKTQFQDL